VAFVAWYVRTDYLVNLRIEAKPPVRASVGGGGQCTWVDIAIIANDTHACPMRALLLPFLHLRCTFVRVVID
jgi:hypothetical protein